MTIGQLAKRCGTGEQTIRYYESIGVLSLPERNSSGYRIYGEETIHTLGFIKRAQAAGFTLNEIKTLIALAEGRVNQCDEIRQFLGDKLDRVRGNITDLKAIEVGLAELVSRCEDSDTVDDCPALSKLLGGPLPTEPSYET